MKYMGSKSRIAKHILPIMLEECEKHGINTWVEPFVGGANMIDKVPDSFERIGYDNNRYLIDMYNHIQCNGFDYDEEINKDKYGLIRNLYNANCNLSDDQYVPDSYIGWVGFMASANGRFFEGGYSGKSNTKIGTVRDYIAESVKGLKKQFPSIQTVKFVHDDYRNTSFKNTIIYCDPPYKGTKAYSTSKDFDHETFYGWCREQAKHNIVFVSEYNAPEDFECVWQQEVKSSLSANGVAGGNKVSVEKLFRVSGVEK